MHDRRDVLKKIIRNVFFGFIIKDANQFLLAIFQKDSSKFPQEVKTLVKGITISFIEKNGFDAFKQKQKITDDIDYQSQVNLFYNLFLKFVRGEGAFYSLKNVIVKLINEYIQISRIGPELPFKEFITTANNDFELVWNDIWAEFLKNKEIMAKLTKIKIRDKTPQDKLPATPYYARRTQAKTVQDAKVESQVIIKFKKKLTEQEFNNSLNRLIVRIIG